VSKSEKVVGCTKDRRKEMGHGRSTAMNRKKEEGPREQWALEMETAPGNKDTSSK
jgi:hypothetical protein